VAAVVHRLTSTAAKTSPGRLARRAHVNKECFILEKNGVAVAAILDVEELEDYLELRDPAIRRQIKNSNQDILAGKTRPASRFLAELKQTRASRARRARSQRASHDSATS